MVPANATLLKPPPANSGCTRCFVDGDWIQVEDHRGETYCTSARQPVEINTLGPIPDGLLRAMPLLTEAKKLASLRLERNARLAATDWTQLPDSPLADEAKERYAVYRQMLRDLPDTVEDLDQVEWPDAYILS